MCRDFSVKTKPCQVSHQPPPPLDLHLVPHLWAQSCVSSRGHRRSRTEGVDQLPLLAAAFLRSSGCPLSYQGKNQENSLDGTVRHNSTKAPRSTCLPKCPPSANCWVTEGGPTTLGSQVVDLEITWRRELSVETTPATIEDSKPITAHSVD